MGISGFNKMMQKEFKKSFAQPKSDGGPQYKNNNNNNNRSNSNYSSSTSSSSSSSLTDIKNAYKLDPRRLASFDHVYVDVNNVLHVAAHHTKTESAFYKKLFGLLTGIIRRTRPRYSITFALDGPAPMAKTITQRRRRVRLSSGEREPLSTDLSRMMKLGITPGSRLALKVDRAIEYYIASKVHREDFGPDILYELSGTTVPGEGEIKLVRAMQLRQENPNFRNHTHCIVSEDSDAILLALTVNPTMDVFVSGAQRLVFSARMFNEELAMSLNPNSKVLSAENNLSGAGGAGTANKSKRQAKREMEMNEYNQKRGGELQAPSAKKSSSNSSDTSVENRSGDEGDDGQSWWSGILPDRKKYPKEYAEELSAIRRDFVGLSVMSGNDYISGSRFGVKFSWRNYVRVRSCKMFKGRNRLFPGPPSNSKDPLFQLRLERDRRSQPMTGMDDTVNWAMLKALAGTLLNPNYLDWLEENDASAFKHTGKYASPLAKDMVTIKDFAINYSMLASMPAEDFAHVWNNFSNVNENNDSSVKRVYDYMYGVEWVLATYHAGECADFSFYTLYDSSTRPRLVNQVGGLGGNDLLDYASIPDTFDKNCDPLRDKTRAEAVFYNKAPITPLAYSLAVIPRGGRAQLCKGIQSLVDPNSPLRELFVCDYCARCIKHRIKVAPLERTLQQQLSGNRTGKALVGSKNTSAGNVDQNESKKKQSKKSGNSSRMDELLAKKSPMYVEVLNDGDESDDDISDVIIIEDGDEDEDNEDESEDGSVKVFLSSDEDDELSDDNFDASEYVDPPLEFPSKKTYKSYEEVRDELRRLNRNHLQHVKNAYVHVDKPPMSLPSLEAAVARLSADELLSKDEEVLRTIGSPVLYWKRKVLDTNDVEEQDFYTMREMEAWRSEITPPGCKSLTEGVTSIRRYDGDVSHVLKEWRKRRFRGGQWKNNKKEQEKQKPQQRSQSPPSTREQQQRRSSSDQPSQRRFRGGRGSSATQPGRSGGRRGNPKPPKAPPPSAMMMTYRVAF